MRVERPEVVLTLVCTECHRGWYAAAPEKCDRCGRKSETRGVVAHVPLPNECSGSSSG